ncbi:carbamoyltransferase HypF [Anaeromyxobacter paludicola]|uniref:Carbamoyltransferase n=1 Tax=Anaeromyxobacter paludicola TaxID=2918171 RepID=A0ABM7XBB3_9BACT|nr:carbamoyltransferase HypF [Anaeromyxobacter paludicola]BDG09164.1 carbamoyltransferase HypF [Anaeromyxobacter paludicola]
MAIRGTVQGVGMRPFVFRVAGACRIRGRVRNDARGVTIEAFGAPADLDAFLARLEADKPPAARFDAVEVAPIPAEPAPDFRIVESEGTGASAELRVSIPADLATCPDCLRELADPANKRHRYPFTNCTNCGPRFTIARGVPYDRPLTTMAAFPLCPDCRREYETPTDRRFHAEPNACPVCGPHLTLLAPGGAPLADRDAALRQAGRALADGKILAVKGLGGFHLACDATSAEAVATLRARKHREEKPLAVMVPDLDAAEALAHLTDADRELLASVERPIVLARRREPSPLAAGIAPATPLVGLLLPYAPLHHLLLAEAGRPLVMTSANLSEEPIAYRNAEALERLGGICDLFLVHDREIETRCDDSVARVVAGRPLVMRRSRGYVPRAVPAPARFERPVLACGAHLKNTFCIGLGDAAWLGPHIGDLENLETTESFESAVARLERFLETRPALLAHDLHPQYLSTAYALRRAAELGIPAVGVQHHHAHVAAGMAEHGLEGPVLGLAWDGTGFGPDGSSWGGELLLAGYAGYERLATLRPLPLAGADTAVRQPWRVALAALDDAFDGAPPLEALPLFRGLPPAEVELVRRMIRGGFNSPLAHGAGRWFDAAGALVLGRARARHEGQVAMALEGAADPAERGAYPFRIDDGRAPWELDLRPAVRALVEDLLAGAPAPAVAARFHETLAAAAAALVRRAARERGGLPVVASGGCFQNARLAERLLGNLAPDFRVYLHGHIPPGDGGIALGQAVVAQAVSTQDPGQRPGGRRS